MKYKTTRRIGLSNAIVLPKGKNSLFHRTKISPNFQNYLSKPNIKGGFRRKVTRLNRTSIADISSFSMLDFV